jgi:hypothetical protein
MAKINLNTADYTRSMDEIYDWLSTNIAPRTIGDTAKDSGPDPGTEDHHYYTGGEGWQYHFVRTTLGPAEADSHLYTLVYGSVSILEPDEMFVFSTAMYLEFENDAHAVMFKLALGGHRGSF